MEPPLEDMTRRRVTVCIRGEWEGPKGLVAHARLVQVAENVWGPLCICGCQMLSNWGVWVQTHAWEASPVPLFRSKAFPLSGLGAEVHNLSPPQHNVPGYFRWGLLSRRPSNTLHCPNLLTLPCPLYKHAPRTQSTGFLSHPWPGHSRP